MSADRSADNPRQNVTFPSNGNQAHGYLVTPESGSGPGLVVIQEWWGLTDHVVDVCNRFADEGYVALAPDLYGGPTTHDADEAGRMMEQLPVDRAAHDLSGAVDYLIGHDAVTGERVGAVGFCMGGGFVLQLAAATGGKVAAAVPFLRCLGRRPAGHVRRTGRRTRPLRRARRLQPAGPGAGTARPAARAGRR